MTPLPSISALVSRQDAAYQMAHLDEDYTRNLGGFLIVLVFLSFASMCMRVACRRYKRDPLGRDDWVYIIGTILSICSFIVLLLYAFDAGLGKHWLALTPDQKILFPKLNYAYNILNVSAYPLVKISILLLYIRIFYVLPDFCRSVWIGIAVVGGGGLANTLVAIFACHPVQGFYDTSVPAQCIDSISFYYWTGAFNCATDIFILVMPVAAIWKRDISHKAAVMTLFLLGGLTCIISVLRIIYYFKYDDADPSYSFLDSAYATPSEVCLATIVASAPAWGPLWHLTSRRLRRIYDSFATRTMNGRDVNQTGERTGSELNPIAFRRETEKSASTVAVGDHPSRNSTQREVIMEIP